MRGFTGPLLCLAVVALVEGTVSAQEAEKQLILTITAKELRNGVVSEIAWDGGTMVIQGVFVQPGGELAAQYFVKPANAAVVERREEHTAASLKYWETKSKRISPTGLGRISVGSDTKMPAYGVGSLEQRVVDAVDMGGTLTTHVVRLGDMVIHERVSPTVPYDGETWSWSPAVLNRIAYVDKKGDLWVASADGRSPRRILRGNFTLPAWSEDGRVIAVVEHKGARWEVSVVHLPQDLSQ
jgi:hypothetical protein